MMYKFYVIFIIGFLLLGCTKPPPSPLPGGLQEVSGLLMPAELSLVRRGTHVLLRDGVQTYFVESKVVALRSFEEKEVTVRGLFEQNTDPNDLPVLIADDVRAQTESWNNISIEPLGLTLNIPPDWTLERVRQGILLTAPLSKAPLIRILREELSAASGTPIRVGGRSGWRSLNEVSGRQQISIPLEGYSVLIDFMPHIPEDLNNERAIFLRILHSLKWQIFTSASSQSSLPKEYGAPCGGTAGVLCPQGFYCEIMDFKEGIGRCVKI